VLLSAAVGLAWSAARWPSGRPATGTLQDLTLVLPANFGRGVVVPGTTADLLLVAVLVGALGCLWERRSTLLASPDARAIIVGASILLIGTGPYAFYIYEPFGVGDRFNYVSSVGGAMIWAGLLMWVVARLGKPGWLVLLGCTALVLGGRLHESDLWSRAGLDASRFVAATARQNPDPQGPIVVAPGVISAEDVGPFFDAPNIVVAIQSAYGSRPIDVRVAASEASYAEAAADPEVITVDQRPTSTLLEVSSASVQYP
jgi:hypothetical protein